MKKDNIMKKDDCIFCKLANGDIPTTTLYEDEDFRAILDLGPATKGHTLILPKEHFRDLTELSPEISSKVLGVARHIGMALMKGLGAKGFNVIQNNGEAAGQTVMHYHVHVIPRYSAKEMPLWTPGTLSDETAAEVLSAVKIK